MDTSKIKSKLQTEGTYWSFMKYTIAEIVDVFPLVNNLPKTINRKITKDTNTNAEVLFDEEGIVLQATKEDKKFCERLDLNNLDISDDGWHLIESEYKRVLNNLNEWKGATNVETGAPAA